MAACEVCGNEYDKPIRVSVAGFDHVFDSFECAIHALAPRCEHCGCTVIGHGTEADGRFFCCAHCAHAEGVERIADRVDAKAGV
jgi:Rieske Fe-S protein